MVAYGTVEKKTQSAIAVAGYIALEGGFAHGDKVLYLFLYLSCPRGISRGLQLVKVELLWVVHEKVLYLFLYLSCPRGISRGVAIGQGGIAVGGV